MSHKLVLGNRFSQIIPRLPQHLSRRLRKKFTVELEDEDTTWCGYDAKASAIYTGLAPFFKNFCKKNNVNVEWVDRREKPKGQPFETNWTMREYQEPAVQKMVEVGRGSVSLATGAGKTPIILEAFARIGVKGVVIAPTQIIWGQFVKTAVKMYLNEDEELPEDFDDMPTKEAWEWAQGKTRVDIGIAGQSTWKPGFLTICIAASLNGSKRSRELLKSIEFFACDETHHLAADSWFAAVMRSNAYYRFGGSGTVLRTDGQDLKLFAPTGPIIHTITSSELIRLGWLAKPKIKMIRCDLHGMGDPRYWADYYRANVCYDIGRTCVARDLIIQSVHRNIKTLCLVAWDEHARNILARIMLEERQYIDYIRADHGKKSIKEAISRFASGEIRVLLATPLLSEGYDLCSIDRLIRASAMQSFIKVTQETGRVLRIENPPQVGVCTEVYDFYDLDGGGPLQEHSQARLEAWQSEEEFDVEVVEDWRQRSIDDIQLPEDTWDPNADWDPDKVSNRVLELLWE